ncbi:MAG: pyrimidine 5'-nucleotidase [Anaerolineaceae bacterium]
MINYETEIKTIFFDLDDTLYPRSSGVWPTIGKRIELFMHEKLGLSLEEIPTLRRSLFKIYGTTLRGLQMDYHIDPHDYLAYVHDIPLEQYLQPDPALREIISAYSQRKMIFTNADSKHAGRVIKTLGLDDCFEGIIDILDISPYCKPMPEAFQIALKLAGEIPPQECLFIDDNPSNLMAAAGLGFQTICVGRPEMTPIEFKCIPDLLSLPTVFPFNGKEK